ncbi:rhamnosyltransferase [Volucribacter psittacicida]|uniref:Rhamnosyltransferase n=1 Tax=Volucribacter psittacicida TaxID=203482 RepID=A0A4R1FSL0_9PAST|nr:glycosyltransferase family 2 protein [Volucribacter psittacicida]TCJ97987.1 rhamnosyltransferase [Volucribacter psittacicida]
MLKISVIIPTYNAEKCLSTLLNTLISQTNRYDELIIIDSSSKDNTVNIAKNYTDKIIIIPTNEFDHGGTRAKAAEIATGDILIFFTQDALPYDNYCVEEILSVFKDENIVAAYGRQIPYENTNLFGKHLRYFNYPEESLYRNKSDITKYGIKTAQLSNSFCAYRKDKLIEQGNFSNNLILGEDVYIGTKFILAGYTLAYTANAKVYHSHSYSILEDFKRYFDIGVFHKNENWIIQNLAKAEGEGVKYIRSELSFLLKNKAYYLIPEWFIRNSMKLIGYKLGMNYEYLPKWIIKKCSMHNKWWNTNE